MIELTTAVSFLYMQSCFQNPVTQYSDGQTVSKIQLWTRLSSHPEVHTVWVTFGQFNKNPQSNLNSQMLEEDNSSTLSLYLVTMLFHKSFLGFYPTFCEAPLHVGWEVDSIHLFQSLLSLPVHFHSGIHTPKLRWRPRRAIALISGICQLLPVIYTLIPEPEAAQIL